MQRFLNRLLSHSELSEEEQDAILSLRGEPSRVRANIDIVRLGDRTDCAYLVVNGIVGHFGQLRDGSKQIIGFHLAGDMCDLRSVILPKVGCSIQALTASAVLKIPHTQLRHVAWEYPAVAEAFWRDCVVDASILSQWIVNVGRRDARMRLAHLLCEMAVRMEQAGLGKRTCYQLNITQGQYADALGLTAVHLNRTLRSLRADGLITARNREICILDWDRLASIGEFDDAYLENGRARQ